MAEGRKSHLSQGGRGNGIQERERFSHKVNYSIVCSRPSCQPVAVGYLFPEEDIRAKDLTKITSKKGLSNCDLQWLII